MKLLMNSELSEKARERITEIAHASLAYGECMMGEHAHQESIRLFSFISTLIVT